jgi:hypothetical protein
VTGFGTLQGERGGGGQGATGAGEMRAAVGVEDERAGFVGDDRPRGGVPGAVAEQDAGVEGAIGDPDQFERGGAQTFSIDPYQGRPWIIYE